MRKRTPLQEIINKKYGRLTIVNEVKPHTLPKGQKHRKMLCRCDCGNYKEILLGALIAGKTKSCGCLRKEGNNYRHGFKYHPLYKKWKNMKQRCYNPKYTNYKCWGGRGISVCDEWINDPRAFIEWALINGWDKGLTIDRKNNDGNYEPDNCRFVTKRESNQNKRSAHSK